VADDVLHLATLERFVDEHGDRPCGKRAEERGGRVAAPRQEDGHPIARLDAGVEEQPRDAQGTTGQRLVVPRSLGRDDGDPIGIPACGVEQRDCEIPRMR